MLSLQNLHLWASNSCTHGFKFRDARPRFYDRPTGRRFDPGFWYSVSCLLRLSRSQHSADVVFGLIWSHSISRNGKENPHVIILSYSRNVSIFSKFVVSHTSLYIFQFFQIKQSNSFSELISRENVLKVLKSRYKI